MLFPLDGAAMLVGSAITIFDILCANAVAVLRDFSGDPIGLREGADDVADKLRLADAAGVAADDDHAPMWSCAHFTSLPAWLPVS